MYMTFQQLIHEANIKFNIMKALQNTVQPGTGNCEPCPPQNDARPPYNPAGAVNFPPQNFNPPTGPPNFPLVSCSGSFAVVFVDFILCIYIIVNNYYITVEPLSYIYAKERERFVLEVQSLRTIYIRSFVKYV